MINLLEDNTEEYLYDFMITKKIIKHDMKSTSQKGKKWINPNMLKLTISFHQKSPLRKQIGNMYTNKTYILT